MCGIAGIISPFQDHFTGRLQKMIACIAHRGPDGGHSWQNEQGCVQLSHKRLAVIDLTDSAAQPMQYLERYTIVHNGEIYNYLELRKTLLQKGYRFNSRSDTEVILAAYDCWGMDCLKELDGMFAFAVWDEKDKVLFAARDRFGQKPFYYTIDHEKRVLYFASEIKALKSIQPAAGINHHQLLLYLSNGFTNNGPHHESTFYDQIFQLPPASFLTFRPFENSNSFSISSYWDLDKNYQRTITEADAMDQFNALLRESVSKCFRSDVAIGTSLSGGLDSSAIVALANEEQFDKNSYNVFSAVFPGFEKDELLYSRSVAQKFNLKQHTISPSANDLSNEFDKFLLFHDEPVSSSSAYAQFKVYELAKKHRIKVLLDGQGADEILAGYTKYIHWFLQELLVNQKENYRKELEFLRSRRIAFNWDWRNKLAARFPSFTSEALKKRLVRNIVNNENLDRDYANSFCKAELLYKPVVKKLNDILYFNLCQGGLQELLRFADRNSMAHGCEVRLPFLDHRLAEFVFSLPPAFKIHNGYTKWLLRKVVESKLPGEIVWRKDKVGFEPPQANWMADDKIQQMITESKEILVKEKILSPAVLSKRNQPHGAHAAESFDWRYLAAGRWIKLFRDF